MAPEFQHGHIVIVDPGMSARDGDYVVIDYAGDTAMRQLVISGERRFLKALNNKYPTVEILGAHKIHGVVVQRAGPRRKERKHYNSGSSPQARNQ